MEPHESGNYYVQDGSIFNRYNNSFFDEDVTIIIDTSEGILLKVGKKDNITKYFETMCSKYNNMGLTDMISSMKLITFYVKYPNLGFEPDGYNFDIDEICTIINWFNNHIGPDNMNEFLNQSLDEMKCKIKKLQNIGF